MLTKLLKDSLNTIRDETLLKTHRYEGNRFLDLSSQFAID